MRRFLGLAFVAVMLAGCSGMKTHTEVEALKEAQAVGSPFTQRLTAEYKDMVRRKQRVFDYADARHFAKKGRMAAEGKTVLPEVLSNWHLDEKSLTTLNSARKRLLGVLDGGGRLQAPFEAGTAQARFDCWVEEQEQHWISPMPKKCRAQFEKAMIDLESRVKSALPKSIKADEALPMSPMPQADKVVVENDPDSMKNSMDEGMFLVFFDFDRSTLNSSGLQVIDAMAAQANKRNDVGQIVVVGHADTSGPAVYNQKLSLRRADAVKTALVKQGIAASQIRTEARGENAPMVATPNNTREPANRRAEIRFE